ncbi:putative transporter MCH2 [Smittium mucronatum]|uniref:Putative transporter MCH2 n=1 Tax=Smittium mucronatum TaxID=133383 RepID=A0A1R0H2J1_9FUNG|nr:putative transporter MCH2 [Smittium mucronatum]
MELEKALVVQQDTPQELTKFDPSDTSQYDTHEETKEELQGVPQNPPVVNGELDSKKSFFILFICVIINVVTAGVCNSFAVFNTLYLKLFSKDQASSIGWIGTMNIASMLLFSLIATPLIHYVGYRKTTLLGGAICGVALLLACFSTQIWQLALTQGVLFGLGASFPFLISVAMVAFWFEKYRGFGMGAINAGGGIGGIILSPIMQKLIDSGGGNNYKRALWVSAIIVFVILAFSSIFMIERVPVNSRDGSEPKKSKPFDKAAVFDVFVFLVSVSTLFGDVAYTAPLYYLPTIAEGRSGISSRATLAVVLANIGNLTGSLIIGFLADYIGEMNIIILSDFLITVLLATIWPTTSSDTPILGLSFVYGFFSAAFLSIVPGILGRHYPEHRAPGVIGVMFVYVAIGLIIGGPTAGALYDTSVRINNYYPLILISAVGFFVSGCILICAQIYLRKHRDTKFGYRL